MILQLTQEDYLCRTLMDKLVCPRRASASYPKEWMADCDMDALMAELSPFRIVAECVDEQDPDGNSVAMIRFSRSEP